MYVFFSAVLDTNGKMATFLFLPILQKLKPDVFYHHKEFLKEISSIQYQVFVKFRCNKCKIIIYLNFHLLQKRYINYFESELCNKTESGKKLKQVITSQLLTKHFAYPSFPDSLKASIWISV